MSLRNYIFVLFCACHALYGQTNNGTKLITPVVILPLQNHSATGQLTFEDTNNVPGTATLQAPVTITTPYSIVLPAGLSSGCLSVALASGSTWDMAISSCGSGSPVDAAINAAYPVTALDFATCATIPVSANSFTITLPISTSQPPNGQCIWIVNYGSGTVTVAPNGQNLNGGTGSIVLGPGSATAPTGTWIVSDSTNYEAEVFGGGSGGSPTFPVHIALTANYPVTAADFSVCRTIPVSANSITITLPISTAQPTNGQCVWVLNYGTGSVTVAPNGQDINGGTGNVTLGPGSAT
jgi:hypothetical protein